MARGLYIAHGAAAPSKVSATLPFSLAICDRTSGGALLSTGIVPHGHAALLTVGAIQSRVVVVADELAIHPVAYLSFTYDARLIDDFGADQFLSRLKHQLETATLR